MNIDELVARFAALPGAEVGRGPRHPVAPEPGLTDRLTRFFVGEYNGLDRDPGYVEFMWKYAGMRRSDKGDHRLFSIDGFGPGTWDIDHHLGDEELVDDGLFVFADCVVDGDLPEDPLNTYEIDFGLDLTGQRRPGVYRLESSMGVTGPGWIWHAPDFQAFLAEAVANGGVWPRPFRGARS